MNKQQAIIEELKTVFNKLTKQNGYSSDAGNKVSDWDTTFDCDHSLEHIDIRDNGEVQVNRNGTFDYELPVEIEVAFAGKQSPERGRNCIFDIYKILGENQNLKGLGIVQPVSHKIDVDQESRKITGITINIEVKFTTGPWGRD